MARVLNFKLSLKRFYIYLQTIHWNLWNSWEKITLFQMFLLFLLKLLESLQYSLVEWLALGRVWISAVCHVTSNFRLEQFRTNMPLIESPIGAPHPGKVSFVGHKFTQSPRTIALFLYCSKNGATMTGLYFNNFKSFPNYAENFGSATLSFQLKD